MSELGELNEVYFAGKNTGWGFTSVQIKNFLKECGDGYWYVAAVADALKVPLQTIRDNYAPFDSYQKLKSRGLLVLVLNARGAQIAGIVKKAIRDNEGYLTEAGEEAIKVHLGHIMVHMHELVVLLGGSPRGVTTANLNKLADRKSRGVLQGSGDNR